MGLLDSLQSDDGLLGLYLMAAGSAKPQRTSLGEGLLGGLQMVQQQRQGREDRAAREEERKQRAAMQAMQMQLMQAQVGETQAQAAQRQAQAQQAAQAQARQQAFQQRLGAGTSPQQALAGGGGPTPQNAALIGQRQPLDFQQLARDYPDQIDLIKKLAESGNFGRNKVARVEETMEGGRPVKRQFDDYGAPVGDVLPQWKAPVMSDVGGRINAVDPVTLQLLRQFDKSNSPDAILSAETARRGQNMQDARSRESNATQQTNGRIPPGYRLRADGNLEAIPGGPADIKAGELGAKAEQRKQMALQGADRVLETVGEAKGLVGMTTAGLGGTLSAIPASSARNLAAKLETIKANLGFDRLQEMRESSPTGGALGALAVQELTALQSTVSSLDQYQSPAQLRASLDKIERHYGNWRKAVSGGKDATAGGMPSADAIAAELARRAAGGR